MEFLPCVYLPIRISLSNAALFDWPFNTQGLQLGIRAMDLACGEDQLFHCFPIIVYVSRHRLTWPSSSRFKGIIMRQMPPRNAGIAWNTALLPHPVGAIRIRSCWSTASLRIASTWPSRGGKLRRVANVEGNDSGSGQHNGVCSITISSGGFYVSPTVIFKNN